MVIERRAAGQVHWPVIIWEDDFYLADHVLTACWFPWWGPLYKVHLIGGGLGEGHRGLIISLEPADDGERQPGPPQHR